MAKAIKAAEYNPRTICDAALAGLRESLRVFGDLSGFVFNERTGNIVCGHQRRQALGKINLSRSQTGAQRRARRGKRAG